jgi:hypothetical protein
MVTITTKNPTNIIIEGPTTTNAYNIKLTYAILITRFPSLYNAPSLTTLNSIVRYPMFLFSKLYSIFNYFIYFDSERHEASGSGILKLIHLLLVFVSHRKNCIMPYYIIATIFHDFDFKRIELPSV